MQWMEGTKDDAIWEKANDIIAHYLDFVVAQSDNVFLVLEMQFL